MEWLSANPTFGVATLLCSEGEFTALGTCTRAIGLAIIGATGTRSQLRRLLSSGVLARIKLECAVDSPNPATRMGLAIPLVPTTRCRRPLVRTGDLLVPVAGFAAAICAAGAIGPLGGAIGPEATVSTTPVAV